MRKPVANQSNSAIPWCNSQSLESPDGSRVLQNRSFVQSRPSGFSPPRCSSPFSLINSEDRAVQSRAQGKGVG